MTRAKVAVAACLLLALALTAGAQEPQQEGARGAVSDGGGGLRTSTSMEDGGSSNKGAELPSVGEEEGGVDGSNGSEGAESGRKAFVESHPPPRRGDPGETVCQICPQTNNCKRTSQASM